MTAITLDALLAPMPPAQFFAEYHDRQPLHLRGAAGKFASVLSWRVINRLLDMTHIWSSQSLQLMMDGVAVPPEQYCIRATGRDNLSVLQPDAAKLRGWVERGASLVMNDVDSLSPGLAGMSEALEGAGLGKAQANVYVSFQSHKAFPAHYDTHDVWAVQVEGEKTWNIWEGRADYPLPHPVFRSPRPGAPRGGEGQAARAGGAPRRRPALPAARLVPRRAGRGAGQRPHLLRRPRAARHGPGEHPAGARPLRQPSSASPCRARTAARRRASR